MAMNSANAFIVKRQRAGKFVETTKVSFSLRQPRGPECDLAFKKAGAIYEIRNFRVSSDMALKVGAIFLQCLRFGQCSGKFLTFT